MSRGLIVIPSLSEAPSHAAAWHAAVHLDGLDADVLPGSAVTPQNQGRWDWVLVVVTDLHTAQLSWVHSRLRPQRLSCLVRADVAAEDTRLDTCSYGVALTSSFGLVSWEQGPLAPHPTSGPLVSALPGEPPRLWPGLAAHGLSSLPTTPADASLVEVLSNPAGSRLWHDGLVFQLPAPDAPLAHLTRWPDVRTVTWVSRADLGPLHAVPATVEATRNLQNLLPIPVARAVLGTVTLPSRLP